MTHTETTIADFPAFAVVKRAPVDGAIEISASDVLATPNKTRRGATTYGAYRAGSVAGYAEKTGRDPQTLIERAKSRGEPLYWINALAATLTQEAQEKQTRILIEPGDVVRFEGQTFTVASAPNNNLRLIAQ